MKAWPYPGRFPTSEIFLNKKSPLAHGLIGWWPAYGNKGSRMFRDYSDVGNHGIIGPDLQIVDTINGPAYYSPSNSAGASTGNEDEYAQLASVKNFNVFKPITLYAKVNIGDDYIKTIVHNYDLDSGEGWFVSHHASHPMMVRNRGVNGTNYLAYKNTRISNANFYNTWRTVTTVIYPSNTAMEIYVDGDKTGTVSMANTGTPDRIYRGADSLTFFRFQETSTDWCNLYGYCTDVALWNRALSSNEVEMLEHNPYALVATSAMDSQGR